MPVRGQVSPVRRRLFSCDGEGDAQELENRRVVERQLAEIQLEKSKYWNFDFYNEVPLNRADGRYQWQQSTTLPDRPSHPLPPPAGIKRTIDNQVDAPLCKQMKSDSHNNNNRNNQTKITGIDIFQVFLHFPVAILPPLRAIFRTSVS